MLLTKSRIKSPNFQAKQNDHIYSTITPLKHTELAARAATLWCRHPSVPPLMVVFDTATFLFVFAFDLHMKPGLKGLGSRGNTFAACDVGIAHCLFEAIWSRHMWENLVLAENVSLWRASGFVRGNVAGRSCRVASKSLASWHFAV